MLLSENSGEIIKLILPKFKECITHQNKNKVSLNKLLIKIHNDIIEGDKFVQYKLETGCMNATLRLITKEETKKPRIYTNRFFPEHIREYIEKNGKYQLIYPCVINGREITIYFILFSENDLNLLDKYENYARMIYTWLYICDLHSLKKCANTLSVYIYQTPFKKELPNKTTTTLSANNVNTAATLHCAVDGEIVIYREEEWFKVFIHETFHSYGLDFGGFQSTNLKAQVKKIFPIESDFIIEESYAETWARIINCGFVSYSSMEKKTDKNEFLMYMDFCLQNERLFALYQCNKVLQFMGLSYEDIYKTDEISVHLRKNLYREDTNVFAYYVLTGILMNDYYKFLKWCDINNIVFLRFNTTEKNLKYFGDLICALYKSDKMINGIKCISKIINNKVCNNKERNNKERNNKERNNKGQTKPDLDIKWIGSTTRMSCIELR